MADRISPADLVTRLGANYVETFRMLTRLVEGGEVSEYGNVSLVESGLPVAPFNIAFVRGPLADPSSELSRAVNRFRARGLPFLIRFFVPTGPAIVETAKSLGLCDAPAQPGMAMLNAVPIPAPHPHLEIVRARDPQTLHHHAAICARAFAMSVDIMNRLLPPALLGVQDAEVFVGYLDGTPVSSSALFLNNGVAGVYNVATVDDHRRKGLGEAMTWHAVRRGRELGCQFSGLLSSEMGKPVYERMGFRSITAYPTSRVPPDGGVRAAAQSETGHVLK